MRAMTPEEMDRLIRRTEWATICATQPDGTPYAIEATPFWLDETVCFMINPRGGVARCVQANPKVLVKFTMADTGLLNWAGVSYHGSGGFDPDPDARQRGWRELGRVTNTDYSKAASTLKKPDRSPLFRVRMESITGKCSARKGEPCLLADGDTAGVPG